MTSRLNIPDMSRSLGGTSKHPAIIEETTNFQSPACDNRKRHSATRAAPEISELERERERERGHVSFLY